MSLHPRCLLFFFNDTATTEIYTLSLHDALPISPIKWSGICSSALHLVSVRAICADRKSTRLNSSHHRISYAVFCLKKQKRQKQTTTHRLRKNTRNATKHHLPTN